MSLDVKKAYLDEISRLPILTDEEESKCIKNLKLFNELTILKRVYIVYDFEEVLDIDTIILSCNNNKCDDAVKTLLSFFKFKNQYKNYYERLINYVKIKENLGRTLTKEELKKHINIESTIKPLDNHYLLDQVKKYILYQTSFDKIYESNLRLVPYIINKHFDVQSITCVDFVDLCNEGSLGLRRAIQKYDSSKSKFSTYASYWIQCKVQRYLHLNTNIMFNSAREIEEILRINRLIQNLEQEKSRSLTNSEIAVELNISIEDVEKAILFKSGIKSLDEKLYDDDDTSLEDTIESQYTTEDIIFKNIDLEILNNLLSTLTEKERYILIYKYGLFGNKQKTTKEIADHFSNTIASIKYAEERAVRKMRIASKNLISERRK